jgi:hypothetical protein
VTFAARDAYTWWARWKVTSIPAWSCCSMLTPGKTTYAITAMTP